MHNYILSKQMGVSPAMIFKYGCHNHLRSVVLAGPRLAPLRMRGSWPMTLSGGCACSSWWQIRPTGRENVPGRVGVRWDCLAGPVGPHMANVSCELSAAWVHLAPESFQQRTGAFACVGFLGLHHVGG